MDSFRQPIHHYSKVTRSALREAEKILLFAPIFEAYFHCIAKYRTAATHNTLVAALLGSASSGIVNADSYRSFHVLLAALADYPDPSYCTYKSVLAPWLGGEDSGRIAATHGGPSDKATT